MLIASQQQIDQALLKTMECHFGFEVDLQLPAWTNAALILANKTARQIDEPVLYMKYHNLCTHLMMLAGIQYLLGFDLKHCVQLKTLDTQVEDVLARIEHDENCPSAFGIPNTRLYIWPSRLCHLFGPTRF
jgi:hypothetical protein